MRVLAALLFFVGMTPVRAADVVFLGEVHDNPEHHERQAADVAEITPKAIVWEMLTREKALGVTPSLVGNQNALEAVLNWNASGWPDFALYYPIFAAAPEARHYGAEVPRGLAREAMTEGLASAFGPDAAQFGLDNPLPDDQQTAREALQLAAHCDALPEAMLPMMVSVQRLRDGVIARAALQALQDTGGPVVVITGNGHARTDWGAPALLRRAAPGVSIRTVAQAERGFSAPDGGFDEVIWADPVDRPDPCEAFLKRQGN